MSRNIGDQEPSPVRIDANKPIEISCYGGHRAISRADPQTAEFGNAAGKNGSLYLAGYGEFILIDSKRRSSANTFSAATHPWEKTNSANASGSRKG